MIWLKSIDSLPKLLLPQLNTVLRMASAISSYEKNLYHKGTKT
jgi:hypothetical protein